MTPPTILIIEDSDVDFDIFSSVITESGFDIKLWRENSGEEAVAKLLLLQTTRAPLPAIIFLDLNLLGMSGFDVLSALEIHAVLAVIPTIILSTSSSPTDISKAYASGANTYIIKPIRFEDFEITIHSCLDYWLRRATLPSPTLRNIEAKL